MLTPSSPAPNSLILVPSVCFGAPQLNDFFAILVVISVLYPIACVISILVKEKELRIKEGLRMMGLSSVAHTGSWIFHFVIRFFCISLLMVLLSTELFKFRCDSWDSCPALVDDAPRGI